MPDKVVEQLFLPMSWEEARPEFLRKQFELARAVNPMADGYLFNVVAITSNYTINVSDSVIIANATAGAITVTLLEAAQCKNKRLTIKKIDPSANNVIIDGAGSETIDDAAAKTIGAQYLSYDLASDGVEWWIV